MNVREKLAAIENWLGWQDEDMSVGLKSIADAEKLWGFAQSEAGQELPEMADEWEEESFIQAIGYNPFGD